MVYLVRTLVVVLPLCVCSCRKAPENTAAESHTSRNTNRQTFQVKGVVQAVRVAEQEVVIKHEAISNYMPAMTMPFEVKDTNLLTGLKPGQPVSFRLTVTDTDGWVDEIQSLGPPTNAPSNPAGIHRVRDVQPLGLGELLPEYHFTNQLGQPFSTAQFKGQALAITFLFTRCPFPTFCPRMANQFAEAQQKLLAMSPEPANWHLLTISFDPEFDTPPVLKTYAQSHHYEPSRWTFATGELSDIEAFGEQFGLTFWPDGSGSITHNLRTVVIDPSGRVQKVFEGSNWSSDELVAELTKTSASH